MIYPPAMIMFCLAGFMCSLIGCEKLYTDPIPAPSSLPGSMESFTLTNLPSDLLWGIVKYKGQN